MDRIARAGRRADQEERLTCRLLPSPGGCARGKPIYAAWCTLGSPIVAETIAREGFSAVVLDAQHGLWDTASVITGIGAVSHAGATPVVRMPLNDFALVSRALDFGAEAIIAPMINDADDARRFAAAAKYPPLRRAQLGSAARDGAAGAAHRTGGLLARGERGHADAGNDRDSQPRSAMWTRSLRRPASMRCSSALTICRPR